MGITLFCGVILRYLFYVFPIQFHFIFLYLSNFFKLSPYEDCGKLILKIIWGKLGGKVEKIFKCTLIFYLFCTILKMG